MHQPLSGGIGTFPSILSNTPRTTSEIETPIRVVLSISMASRRNVNVR